ncbi:hypothetical protein DEIPH_ctg017orf0211 [Deinococcus phoenicis]|uniref:Helix-turn-helix domain-containing protein n=1 Tax=Deinococcus phoenicis TaxID=1476583 RepID=A0A016QRR0_9DEIO|nr:hypothetical protein [Deinococcus phoenicis]EYB68835.1 hypothetical protein DEIPH_ctg017orf0211 [Deinococcus phoenicis]
MTSLEVRLSPDQLAELADLIAARVQVGATVPAPLKLAYTIKEAAEITSTTEWCIRTAIRQGELHAKQAGDSGRGAYSIPADSLQAWLYNRPTSNPRLRKAAGQR